MPSIISRLQRSFLKKKDNSTVSKTGTGVHSEADLHTPEKLPIKASSASFVPPTPTKTDTPQSPRSPKSPTNRSIPILPKTTSKKSLSQPRPSDAAPQLALKLPDPGPVDERTEPFLSGISRTLLDKRTLRAKRLKPEETLQLLKPAGVVVVERGLDTLGIFRPHWHSENADVQQALLSVFLSSLTGEGPGASSPSGDAFLTELRYTSDPHDVTSILKWGLRHLEFEHGGFGRSSAGDSVANTDWAWYRDYSSGERQAGYPASAFTSILLPRLPPAHAVLLKNLMDTISSVGSHVARNAMSGNRLSKALAIWVIAPRKSDTVSFATFYERWETAARVMEHLFLSFVRDMERQHMLPTRLAELVAHYPFTKSPSPEDFLLPRPNLTTHQFKALHVRIKQTQPNGRIGGPHLAPLKLLEEAIGAKDDEGVQHTEELKAIWDALVSQVNSHNADSPESKPFLQPGKLVSEESLRIVSLRQDDGPLTPSSPSAPGSSLRQSPSRRNKRRSFSMDHGRSRPSHGPLTVLYEDAPTNGRIRSEEDLSAPINGTKVDWDSFSSSGFDALGTTPSLAQSLSSRSASATPVLSATPSTDADILSTKMLPSLEAPPSFVVGLSLAHIDEAFVDAWSDTVLDPVIRKNWPDFMLCQLSDASKTVCVKEGVEWLIIEREVVIPPSPAKTQAIQRSPSNVSAATTTRFTRSFGRATAEMTARKRFSLFSTSSGRSVRGRKESTATVASKHTTVSEVGEVPPLPSPKTPVLTTSASDGQPAVVVQPSS